MLAQLRNETDRPDAARGLARDPIGPSDPTLYKASGSLSQILAIPFFVPCAVPSWPHAAPPLPRRCHLLHHHRFPILLRRPSFPLPSRRRRRPHLSLTAHGGGTAGVRSHFSSMARRCGAGAAGGGSPSLAPWMAHGCWSMARASHLLRVCILILLPLPSQPPPPPPAVSSAHWSSPLPPATLLRTLLASLNDVVPVMCL